MFPWTLCPLCCMIGSERVKSFLDLEKDKKTRKRENEGGGVEIMAHKIDFYGLEMFSLISEVF